MDRSFNQFLTLRSVVIKKQILRHDGEINKLWFKFG